MRSILQASLALLLLVQTAVAQQSAPVTVTEHPVADVPVTQNPNAMNALAKALGNGKMQQNMGQVMVIGTLIGCVKKQVGNEKAQAFYTKMHTAGEEIGKLCKNDQPVQARDLVLKTVDANASDPTAKVTLTCYDGMAKDIPTMGGQRMADDAGKYARWLRDPAAAHREITPSDICRNQK